MAEPQYLILILVGAIYFLPAVLLLIGGVLVRKRIGGASGVLIAIGAVLLSLTAVSAVGNIYIGMQGSAEDIRDFALRWGTLIEICRFIGIIFIALGLIFLSRRRQGVGRVFE